MVKANQSMARRLPVLLICLTSLVFCGVVAQAADRGARNNLESDDHVVAEKNKAGGGRAPALQRDSAGLFSEFRVGSVSGSAGGIGGVASAGRILFSACAEMGAIDVDVLGVAAPSTNDLGQLRVIQFPGCHCLGPPSVVPGWNQLMATYLAIGLPGNTVFPNGLRRARLAIEVLCHGSAAATWCSTIGLVWITGASFVRTHWSQGCSADVSPRPSSGIKHESP
jgi:hypothetical protein